MSTSGKNQKNFEYILDKRASDLNTFLLSVFPKEIFLQQVLSLFATPLIIGWEWELNF